MTEITTEMMWEALKEVAGASPDKSKIKTLVAIRKKDVKAAMDKLRAGMQEAKARGL